MANQRTGRGTVLFGLLVLLAGLTGAVVLYLVSQQRTDDAIRDLARAPVGCDTTLSFSDTGTFYVYIEHLGTLERLDGDCETPNEYSRDADDQPTVEIVVRDEDDQELDLDRLDDEFTYALGDEFAGTATRQLEIESTGEYVMTVDSNEEDFVVAVGRDPADAATTMRLGAIASGVAGIVLGFGLVLAGVRRGRRMRRITTVYTARPEWPAGVPIATSPPLMGPPTQPLPAPQQAGGWAPGPPVGPPVWSPANPPTPPQPPAHPAPGPGPTVAPHVFAPPGMPTLPTSPPTTSPSAPTTPPPHAPPAPRDASTGGVAVDDRGDGGDVRGGASQ